MTSTILIDANIARSCNNPAREPMSAACLELTVVLSRRDVAVLALLTPALEAEWDVHSSNVFRRWWANMESRGRIRFEHDRRSSDYRAAIGSVTDAGIRGALEKDAHIVEAAIFHGAPVASRDDKQARYVTALIASYPLLGALRWFNPVSDDEWAEWVADELRDPSKYRLDTAR